MLTLRMAVVGCLTALMLLTAMGPAGSGSIAAASENPVTSVVQVPGSTSDGTLLDTSCPSSALDLAPPFRIFLPPGYSTSAERYPVLYLLHGNSPTSDFTEWTENMRIDFTAGSMIVQGQIPPMIIVMPYGDHSYFMNLPGGLRWADYITQDLVPYVDANYRTISDREHRAIGGNSMGATGALHLAFNHPDLFSIVGAHSPALRTAPDAVITDWEGYAPYDPLRLVETAPNLGALRIWLDAGNQDPWRGGAAELHEKLEARGVSHTWNLFDGPHDTPYWVAHSSDYLRFYAAAFREPAPRPSAPAGKNAAPATPGAGPAEEKTAAQPRPQFKLGFKALADQIPDVVGLPVEDEHYEASGDGLQKTTTGLMVWRKADNWTAFTDGANTWIDGPHGLQKRGNQERFPWEPPGPGDGLLVAQ